MPQTTLEMADNAEYLTVSEVADHCGVSTQTVRNWLCTGKFQTYKFKSLTLLKKADLPERGTA